MINVCPLHTSSTRRSISQKWETRGHVDGDKEVIRSREIKKDYHNCKKTTSDQQQQYTISMEEWIVWCMTHGACHTSLHQEEERKSPTSSPKQEVLDTAATRSYRRRGDSYNSCHCHVIMSCIIVMGWDMIWLQWRSGNSMNVSQVEEEWGY